ncbi:MAG: hypothetical protein HOV81_08865 [Kofleriaceae bacterium]|nr:hypothetical protein [Kofleriaceae bacterium]
MSDDRSMLDSLITSAAADEPSEEQLRRLEARIAPLFAGAGAGGGVAAAAKAGKSTLAKWLAGGLTVGALGAGGYAVHRSMQPSSPTAVGVDAAAPDVEALPDAPVPDAASEVTAPTTDAPKQPTRAKPASSADGLAEEARILARAQTALRDGQPARALRDIDRHQAKFPRGALAEERERLAIETLLALGRRDTAEARARHFRSAFPDSLQWDRIRALLDGSK